MSEIKITQIVTFDMLDAGRHVGHAQWITLLERARCEYLSQLGYPFSKLMEEKLFMVVSELSVKYYYPGFYEDELSFKIRAHDIFTKGMYLEQEVYNQNGKRCVKADIKIVTVNENGRPVNTPELLQSKLIEASR